MIDRHVNLRVRLSAQDLYVKTVFILTRVYKVRHAGRKALPLGVKYATSVKMHFLALCV